MQTKNGHFLQVADDQIVAEVMNLFKWNIQVPDGKVNVTVKEGWVVLQGHLQWNYQIKAARDLVAKLSGVKGVTNNIRIDRKIYATVEKNDIEKTLKQTWALCSCKITVVVSGTTLILRGIVHSVYQSGLAANVAKTTSGISSVNNELLVDYAYRLVH